MQIQSPLRRMKSTSSLVANGHQSIERGKKVILKNIKIMFILLRERTKGQLSCELSQIDVVTVSINLYSLYNSGGKSRARDGKIYKLPNTHLIS